MNEDRPIAERLIGASAPMRRLRERIGQIAQTPLPVLVVGETGTGKEVVARAIHDASGRTGPFVPVDCAAMSASLVESELFGHERGAFTGANQRREGLVYAARNGTFFLDEVGELPAAVQTRLLRLLQEGTYRPVGGNDERKADIRVIAATWRNLEAFVDEGRFRRDLYHRLAVVELRVPALRDRKDDIAILLDHYLDKECEAAGKGPLRIADAARAHLLGWPWPGNVRELRNVASYIAAMARGSVAQFDDLPPQVRRGPEGPNPSAVAAIRTDLTYMDARRMWLDAFQDAYVEAQLEANAGNVSAAARASEMDRRSIQRIVARRRGGGRDGD